MYGWGDSAAQSTEDVVAWSSILQETNLTVPHPDVCKAAGDTFCANQTNAQEFPETCGMWQFMDSIPPGLLCAGSTGKGACMVSCQLSPLKPLNCMYFGIFQGDSGAPLTHESIHGQNILIGFFSWALGCARVTIQITYEISFY